MSYAFLLKYIIIGDSGKSCVLLQYTDQRYRQKHQVTIGVQFGARMLKIKQNNIKLQIWDTAGQQSYGAITRGYYRNAIGAIMIYDISNRDSFLHITNWLQDAKSYGPTTLTLMLVGNKTDKMAQRKVTYEQGLRFAKQQGIVFLETSAKNGNNIQQIFSVLTQSILAKIQNKSIDPKNNPGLKIGNQTYLGLKQQFNKSTQKGQTIIISKQNTGKVPKKGCCK